MLEYLLTFFCAIVIFIFYTCLCSNVSRKRTCHYFANSKVKCGCGKTVRIKKEYKGNIEHFKCFVCLGTPRDHYEYCKTCSSLFSSRNTRFKRNMCFSCYQLEQSADYAAQEINGTEDEEYSG